VHARRVLLDELISSWVPGYLQAVATASPAAAPWARLCADALAAERRRSAAASDASDDMAGEHLLPSALRDAPAPLCAEIGFDELLDALVAPLRSGIILTRGDLAALAARAGAGLRHGERRYALRSLLEQAPAETLGALGEHATTWVARHEENAALSGAPVARFWAGRAAESAAVLSHLAGESAPPAA
jgi:hypothetical protein